MAPGEARGEPAAPAAPSGAAGARLRLRQSVAIALVARAIARALLAPLALVTAAAAGLVFALLLPVCGVATIAEAISSASWAFVRDTMSHIRGRGTPRN